MFELTEEQINYIIAVYGGSKVIIKDIERRLNLLGIPMDEDDYYEIVAAVAAQKETISQQVRRCTTKAEAMRKFVSTDSLIKYELNEKYTNFINASAAVQEKMKNYR